MLESVADVAEDLGRTGCGDPEPIGARVVREAAAPAKPGREGADDIAGLREQRDARSGPSAGAGTSLWSGSFIRANGMRRSAAWTSAGSASVAGPAARRARRRRVDLLDDEAAAAGAGVGQVQRQVLRPRRGSRTSTGAAGSPESRPAPQREVEADRAVRDDRGALRQRIVRRVRRLERTATRCPRRGRRNRRPGPGSSGVAKVVVEPSSGRFATVAPFRAAPGVGVDDVARRRDRRESDGAGEGADLDVVHLPPPGEDALVVEAGANVGVPGREGHVRDLGARARLRRSCAVQTFVQVAPPSMLTSTVGDAARGVEDEVDEVVGPPDRRARSAREIDRRRHEERVVD